MNNHRVVVVVLDREGHVVQCNRAFEILTGYTAEDLKGRLFWETCDVPNAAQDMAQALRLLDDASRVIPFEGHITGKDGVQHLISWTGIPCPGLDGVPQWIVGCGTAHTELEDTQQRLQESQERLRQLAEHIQEVFWLCDPALNEIYYISPAYEAVWGRSCQSLYDNPKSFLEAVYPQDRITTAAIIAERIAEGYDIEFRIVRPDGSIRWIRDRAFPIADSSGSVYRIAGIAEDITARKQTEQTLRFQAQILNRATVGPCKRLG